MKYELRLLNGELIGTVELDAQGRRFIPMLLMQQIPFAAFTNNTIQNHVKTVEFEVTDLVWNYRGRIERVPTAILTQGKKTWLRGQKWFRGLR